MNFREYGKRIIKEIEDSMLSVDDGQIEAFVELIIRSPRVFCDGKGRSGLQAKAFAMRLAQMGILAYDTDGVTTPAIDKQDLLIIASGSGKTPGLVEHAAKAEAAGATIALITAKEESPIGEKSNVCFRFQAASKEEPEKSSIQPMGTLFEQSLELFFDTLVLILMDKLPVKSSEMYRLHKNLE